MMERGGGTEDGDASAILIPLHEARRERLDLPVAFERRELDLILRLYGRMVAANEWRDYAIDHLTDRGLISRIRHLQGEGGVRWADRRAVRATADEQADQHQ